MLTGRLAAAARGSRKAFLGARNASNAAVLNHLGRYYNPKTEDEKAAFKQLYQQSLDKERPQPFTDDQELFRRHNTSLPVLTGQRVYGRIMRLDRQVAWVDIGFKGPVRVPKSELKMSHLVASKGTGGARKSPDDFRQGDVLTFLIEFVSDAFGDTLLSTGALTKDTTPDKLLQHLQHHFDRELPISGRILNSVPGGYAVGVAGFVAFCPFTSCSIYTASSVGVLQPFLIQHLDPTDMGTFRLLDLRVQQRTQAFNAEGDKTKGPDYRANPIAADLQRPQR